MSGSNRITSNVTGKTYKTANGNCKTKCIVYGVDCILCKKQYVGKSDNKSQKRISGHRSHVHKDTSPEDDDTDEAALANHLKTEHSLTSVEDFNSTYKFTILEVEPESLDLCEQKWVNLLVTLQPFGLNIEKPLGIADSITKQANSQR